VWDVFKHILTESRVLGFALFQSPKGILAKFFHLFVDATAFKCRFVLLIIIAHLWLFVNIGQCWSLWAFHILTLLNDLALHDLTLKILAGISLGKKSTALATFLKLRGVAAKQTIAYRLALIDFHLVGGHYILAACLRLI
jgi:hypothetical protein